MPIKNAKTLPDGTAFLRKIQRDNKNRDWERDINRYYAWKKLADKYNSEIAKEMMENIKARWPDICFE